MAVKLGLRRSEGKKVLCSNVSRTTAATVEHPICTV